MADVDLTFPREGIALLTLNRPESLNAMTSEMVEMLHLRLDEIAVNRHVRVVVLMLTACAGGGAHTGGVDRGDTIH